MKMSEMKEIREKARESEINDRAAWVNIESRKGQDHFLTLIFQDIEIENISEIIKEISDLIENEIDYRFEIIEMISGDIHIRIH